MRRRRPDVDEEVLLPLEDDDPEPAPDGRIVEVGPAGGNRRRDLGLLVAVVALVAGIGLLGDDGTTGEERAEADATTTTTGRRTTSTSRPRPTTTAPALPIVTVTEGTGPVAPGAPTGSAIVTTSGDEVVVVDLDTGERCQLEIPGARNGGLWVGRGTGRWANVNGNTGAFLVAAGCRIDESRARAVVELLPSDRPDHVWELHFLGEGVRLVEQAADGSVSGRQVEIPVWTGAIHTVAGGFVTDVFGSVTFVDATTGAARELADGFTVAAGGETVSTIDCEAFDCDLVVLDLGGRELLRRSTGRPAHGWQAGAVSPDGRWLAYLTAGDAGVPNGWLVDLATGRERDLGRSDGGSPIAFTATSSHAVVRTTRGLHLVPVDGGEPVDIDEITRAGQPFAVIATAPDGG